VPLKRLHTLVLRSFLFPFVITFFLSLFLLVMQFLWKYADDLMGKGLEAPIVAELMFYATANLVPMALPLAILLSSLMAFGNLGENNELTAMKSGGLSLLRIMFPAAVFVFLLSVGAFFFSNYTWPAANLNMRLLINDITQKKPAIAIREGVFYDDIDGISIKVQEKVDNEHFYDVLIIDQSNQNGAGRREIKADRAWMRVTPDKQFMLLDLYSGTIDEELDRRRIRDSRQPYQQTEFGHIALKVPLTDFNLQRTDLNQYQESYEMLSAAQLLDGIDSIQQQRDSMYFYMAENLMHMYYIFRDTETTLLKDFPVHQAIEPSPQEWRQTYQIAISSLRRKQELVNSQTDLMMEDLYDQMTRFYYIAFHRKFTLSYACFLLFFIGAPLGAIIRKGGFGLPVVFSILMFITYYMISISGEKMGKTGTMSAFDGMWLSAYVLTPIAVFLTIQAMNDARLLDMDTYKRIFRRRKRSTP
jgi:lipopolysaccharide export system permease protein